MKSTKQALRNRGMIDEVDTALMRRRTQEELYEILCTEDAAQRTAAVRVLGERYSLTAKLTAVLLNLLKNEACLYTRLEICAVLEKGDIATARYMLSYLGQIGKNQYRKTPNSVSKKKSYPLPRDVIARSLGKMTIEILPVLLEFLKTGDENRISEALDAIGFLVFYNSCAAEKRAVLHIFDVMERYQDTILILWKAVICLSAFPLPEAEEKLSTIKNQNQNTILEKEAERSLNLIQMRKRK